MFGRDSILNIGHEANWKFIQARKQHLIRQNNIREKRKRIPHTYRVGNKVLIKQDQSAKYANVLYKGPYSVLAIYDNGTVRIDMGIISDTYNLRLLASNSPMHG